MFLDAVGQAFRRLLPGAAAGKKADGDAAAARNMVNGSQRLSDDDGDLQGAVDRAFDSKFKALARLTEARAKLTKAHKELDALATSDPQYGRKKAEVEQAEVDTWIASDEETYFGGAAFVAGRKLAAADRLLAAANGPGSVPATEADIAAKKIVAEKTRAAFAEKKAYRQKVLSDLKAAQAELHALDVLDPKWRAALEKVKNLRVAEIESRDAYRFADIDAFSAHADYQIASGKPVQVAAATDRNADGVVEQAHAAAPAEAGLPAAASDTVSSDAVTEHPGRNDSADDGSSSEDSDQHGPGTRTNATTRVDTEDDRGAGGDQSYDEGSPATAEEHTVAQRHQDTDTEDDDTPTVHQDTEDDSTPTAHLNIKSENGATTSGGPTATNEAAHQQLSPPPSSTGRQAETHDDGSSTTSPTTKDDADAGSAAG